MADEQIDPGADTGMFRAFVSSAEDYQERASSRGPVVVMLAVLTLAVLMFIVIVARG